MFSILHHDRLNMIDVHTFENKTAAYYTLGCKLNFAETSTLGKILEENGIRKVRSGEKADICVVNTCSVTELADKKCRQTIRKIARQHPGAFIVVTGNTWETCRKNKKEISSRPLPKTSKNSLPLVPEATAPDIF